jgi:hypothetical protein
LFKKIQQYIERNNENYAFQANKRQKGLSWTERLSLGVLTQINIF